MSPVLTNPFIGSFGAGAIDQYEVDVLADGPLRFYDFKEASGNTLFDKSGNAMDGTGSNSPTLTVTNGWAFNGTNQSVSIPTTGLPSGNSPYTVEWVAKPGNVTGQRDALTFGTNASTNQVTATGFNSTNAWNYWNGSNVTTSGVTISTASWWHYCATYDQATLIIYINGVSRASVAKSSHNCVLTAANFAVSMAGNAWFNGNIRRGAIFNTALSPTRVGVHAASAPLT